MTDRRIAMRTADDAAAREAALEAAESIILQAPAGSGKTEVLTQRFLRLLALVDEPEEILAITFTRKAAAEMRRRILRVLDGDIDPERPTAAVLTHLRTAVMSNAVRRRWDLIELRTRLRIQTIDSLNHELARSMPLLGQSLAGLDIAADPEALHREAARLALHDAESEPALQRSMDLIFGRLDNNWGTAEQLLASMLANRAQWLRTVASTPPERLGETVERSLVSIVRSALESLASQLPEAAGDTASRLLRQTARWRLEAGQPVDVRGRSPAWAAWLSPDAALDVDARQLPAWQALADLLLSSKGDWRNRFTIREGGIAPKQDAAREAAQGLLADCARVPGLREALLSVRTLPPPQLGPDEGEALEALARLLRHAAAALRVCFATAGRVDHTEVAFVAREGLQALEGPSDLALRRAAALKHLLLDEFQDTSVEQGELLESLVVGWAAGEGRSAFVVGDPMQSIYQFRNAEVGLFLRARERGIGDLPLRPLALTRNFRSAPALIDWCNRAFESIFPARDELRQSAVRFLSSAAGREAAAIDAPGVRVHRLATDSPLPEAKLLARVVIDARRASPKASIAVLVQAATHAPPIIAALRAAGLPVRGVDLAPLARQPAVRDVVELGCALLHAGDRIAWLATLRAPSCGLGLDDLLALTDDAPPGALVPDLLRDAARLARLSADGRARLARCTPVLLDALAASGRVPFVPALRTTWESLGGAAALDSEAEWGLVQSYLDALAARLRDEPTPTGALLRDLAETLRLGGDAAREDSVEVLTIHKAKGLEWDVVLLPGLHRALRGSERPLLNWIELPREDRSVDLLVAALSIGRGRNDDRLGDYIALLRKQRQQHERCRLAYVAATRARERLHLFAYAEEKDGELVPRGNSMLKTFWPAIADALRDAAPQGEKEAPVVAPASDPAAGRTAASKRLPARWQPAPAAGLPALPRLDGGVEPPEALAPEYLWVGPRRRAIGTVVHAELERWAAHGDAAASTRRQRAWRLQLRELGVEVAQLDEAVEDVERILAQVREDPQARWILSAGHRDAASELRLTGVVDGRLRDVVIDRTFVTAEGMRWVIDYKTGTHQGADLERFLAEELARYRPQLLGYRALAERLGPEPVRAALYFPLLQRLVELPAEG